MAAYGMRPVNCTPGHYPPVEANPDISGIGLSNNCNEMVKLASADKAQIDSVGFCYYGLPDLHLLYCEVHT
jgi:hypothetical protein